MKKAIGADLIIYNSQTLMFVGLVSVQLTTGATEQERTALQSIKWDAPEKLVAAKPPPDSGVQGGREGQNDKHI